MNVYYNKSFTGHWPVGTSALVVAESEQDAATQLAVALVDSGLEQGINPEEMIYVSSTFPAVIILNNGDY